MYSEKRNVLALVALLKAHGITHIILSPGSRNSPLIHSFATDADFTCYSVVDERSAGFFALGIILSTGKPAAVCCTSGTAALNLGPAVAEAFYQELPLLVITADRPAAWIGQMDGQTIPQENLFGKMTRKSVQLPEIKDDEDEWHCNRLINEAILGMDYKVKGPAHINIPLGEPLFGFNETSLPPVRVIRRHDVMHGANLRGNHLHGYAERFASFDKRMIIVGQLPPNHGLDESLERLRTQSGVTILTEHLSNSTIAATSAFDTLLYCLSEEQRTEFAPELVITVGGHIVSKRLKQFIRTANIQEHWHISPSGEVVDTFQRVTDIIGCDNKIFLDYLAEMPINASTQTFRDTWEKSCASITEPEATFSDLFAVGELMRALPEEASLHLGNSNSVRLAQLFKAKRGIEMFCNRGTNGIEGSLSSAVGYAAATERLTFVLIGDLSFFYDMNALWNRHLGNNLRIMVNNNAGGEIFGILPGLSKSEVLHSHIAAAHDTEAKAWAEQQGFLYLSAKNEEEFLHHLPTFTSAVNDKPILLEVFSSMDDNAEQIRAYYHQQKSGTPIHMEFTTKAVRPSDGLRGTHRSQ